MTLSAQRWLMRALILCSACVYLVGNGRVALWDRDEPRYAQTSRQMLQSGDWVVPRFLDKDRTGKPALIYWCQATAMKVFGDGNFAARFPSAVAVLLLLALIWQVLLPALGGTVTAWTVFVFATSGLTIAAAKMSITDAVLLLFVTTAQLCLYALVSGYRPWKVVLTLAVAIGLAGLTKGPVVLGVMATTLLALGLLGLINRKFDTRNIAANRGRVAEDVRPVSKATSFWWPFLAKSVVGCLVVIGIILPWVLMVNYRSAGFIGTSLKVNVWDRMMTPLEQHSGPPGYYLLTVWVTFFPWSLLLPMTLVQAFSRLDDFRTRFALAAIIGPWLMLESVRTKLPHYLLPIFPPLAYLTAETIVRSLRNRGGNLLSRPFMVAVGLWAIAVGVVASAPWLASLKHVPVPRASMWLMSVYGLAFGGAVFAGFRRQRASAGLLLMGLGTFGLFLLMYAFYLPRAEFLRVSPRVAKVLIDHGVTKPGQVLMLEYMEPSLAFAQGGTIREAGQLGFTKKFEPQLTPWLVLPRSFYDKAPADLRNDFEVVDHVYGLAYADRGKWVDVLVLHRRDASK